MDWARVLTDRVDPDLGAPGTATARGGHRSGGNRDHDGGKCAAAEHVYETHRPPLPSPEVPSTDGSGRMYERASGGRQHARDLVAQTGQQVRDVGVLGVERERVLARRDRVR